MANTQQKDAKDTKTPRTVSVQDEAADFCGNSIVVPVVLAEQLETELAESHERIDWLEGQREIERQQKDNALNESRELLAERDMLLNTERQLANMAGSYKEQIEDLKCTLAQQKRGYEARIGELLFNADKALRASARVKDPVDKPTEPGWYWLESNDEWTIVHLRLEANGSLKANSLFPVNELKGRWYRILPPIPLRPSRPSVQPLPSVQ